MPVAVRCWVRQISVRERILTIVAQKVLDLVGEPEAELSLEIVGNSRIQRLNQQYRGENHPTDVLAFTLPKTPGPSFRLLGDVVISLHMAQAQARRFGHHVDEELLRLLIHGTLHLLGYDHERGGQEARRMRRKERAILQKLGPLPKIAMM